MASQREISDVHSNELPLLIGALLIAIIMLFVQRWEIISVSNDQIFVAHHLDGWTGEVTICTARGERVGAAIGFGVGLKFRCVPATPAEIADLQSNTASP